MAKLTKFAILAGGIMGLAAFFFPFNAVAMEDGTVVSFSSQDMVLQLGRAAETNANASNKLDHLLAQTEAVGPMLWLSILLPIHGAALLLLFLGGWGILRRRFGRCFALISLLLGLFVFIFWAITASTLKTPTPLPGLNLLFGTGLAGVIGGLFALVKPDRAKPSNADPKHDLEN